jgi:hypothetical protein
MRIVMAALLFTGFVIAGCAAAPGLSPSASVTTTMQGWEHYFRIEATETEKPGGGAEIEGYVYNKYGRPATVRLLGQALDGANNVVGQRIVWVPGTVPQLSRAYFKISALPPADHYRVTVWSFDIIDTDSFRRRF